MMIVFLLLLHSEKKGKEMLKTVRKIKSKMKILFLKVKFQTKCTLVHLKEMVFFF